MLFDFKVLLKYILEGLAVAIAAFYIPRRSVDLKEIVLIALTAAAVFSILDQFSPPIGLGARQGAGFGIGLNQVGFGHPVGCGHGHGYHHFGDCPYDLYGGQENESRLSCTCEVDAEYLRGQLCQVHTPPSSDASMTEPNATPNAKTTTSATTKSATTTSTTTATTPPPAMTVSDPANMNPLQTPLGPIQRINIVGPGGQSVSTFPSAQTAGSIEGFDGFSRSF